MALADRAIDKRAKLGRANSRNALCPDGRWGNEPVRLRADGNRQTFIRVLRDVVAQSGDGQALNLSALLFRCCCRRRRLVPSSAQGEGWTQFHRFTQLASRVVDFSRVCIRDCKPLTDLIKSG